MTDFAYGKFQDQLTELLHEVSLDGGCDMEVGSVSEPPMIWHGLLLGSGVRDADFAILTEDDQGFVYSTRYDSQLGAQRAWQELEQLNI